MATYTFIFYALLSMNGAFCRLVKTNTVILNDTTFNWRQVLFWSIQALLSYLRVKNADEQIDGQLAFQLYIITNTTSFFVPNYLCSYTIYQKIFASNIVSQVKILMSLNFILICINVTVFAKTVLNGTLI